MKYPRSGGFYSAMVHAAFERRERLSQNMLNGYVGGQVLMYFPSSRDSFAGRIESIDLAAGSVEVSCSWLARKKFRGRKWRLDERLDNFLVVVLQDGWRRTTTAGGIMIMGSNGNMVLAPKDEGGDEIVDPKTVEGLS